MSDEINETQEQEIVTEDIETTEETEVVELTENQIALRNELAMELFEIEDYTTLSEEDSEKLEKWAARMKVKRTRKSKATGEPKRTAGRKIAPTLRVVDEDTILKALYTMKSSLENVDYKGGWGVTKSIPKATKTMVVIFEDLSAGLQNIITDRKIADDTVVIETEA